MKSHYKDACKFLSGAFFVTAGASWYFFWLRAAVPFPFFGFKEMTPDFLGIRGIVHAALCIFTFYIGFIRR